MIKGLGKALGILWDNACFSVQRLLIPERGSTDTVHTGTSRVLIIKSPNPACFKETVFILRDDLFFTQCDDRRAILREARSAAEDYTLSAAGRKRSPLWRVFYFALGMAVSYILFGVSAM